MPTASIHSTNRLAKHQWTACPCRPNYQMYAECRRPKRAQLPAKINKYYMWTEQKMCSIISKVYKSCVTWWMAVTYMTSNKWSAAPKLINVTEFCCVACVYAAFIFCRLFFYCHLMRIWNHQNSGPGHSNGRIQRYSVMLSAFEMTRGGSFSSSVFVFIAYLVFHSWCALKKWNSVNS